MKKLYIFTLLYSIILSPKADDFSFFDTDDRPLCTDPVVRLSKFPISCIPVDLGQITDGNLSHLIDFDIPELKLNFEDLQHLFDGTESSGGHQVSPSASSPQRIDSFINFKCQAKLLSDGKKRVSFISTYSFNLSDLLSFISMDAIKWKHFLIRGNDIDETQLFPVKIGPQSGYENYTSHLIVLEQNKGLQLSLCESFTDENSATTKICAQKNIPYEEYLNYSFENPIELQLSSELKRNKRVIYKTLKLSCLPF